MSGVRSQLGWRGPGSPTRCQRPGAGGEGQGRPWGSVPRAWLTPLLPRLKSKFVNKLKFDVTFTFSRLPLQVQHRAAALSMQQGLASLLFPSASCNKPLTSGPCQPR